MIGLPYHQSGPNDGVPLLFLHGFLGARQDWQPVMEALEDKARCLALDLPGHGEAAPLAGMNIEETMNAVVQVMDVLDIPVAGLVGYSMGGRIALHAALCLPQRFHFAVIVSASAGIEETERKERRQWEEKWTEIFRSRTMRDALTEWYAQPMFDSLRRSDNFSLVFERRLANCAEAAAAALITLGASRQPDLWKKLSEATVPLLLVVGENDEKYLRKAERCKRILPSAAIRVIKGCGHAVHLEKPSALADVLADILDSMKTRNLKHPEKSRRKI